MDQAKDGQESSFCMITPPLISVRLLSLFLASEKVKVLNHPPYSPYLSHCDFFVFPRLNPASILRKSTSGRHRPVSYDIDLRRMLTGKKILSGNKYTSRSSLGSAIYQRLHQKKTIYLLFATGLKGYKNVFQ